MRRILALLALLCASRMATAAPLTFNEAIALARRQNPSAASTRAQIARSGRIQTSRQACSGWQRQRTGREEGRR